MRGDKFLTYRPIAQPELYMERSCSLCVATPQKAHSEPGKTLVYDPQLPFYKDVLKKDEVWKEIGELLGVTSK